MPGNQLRVARARGAAERAPTLPAASMPEQSGALPTAAGRAPSEPRSIRELTRVLLPGGATNDHPGTGRAAPSAGVRKPRQYARVLSMPPDQSRATARHLRLSLRSATTPSGPRALRSISKHRMMAVQRVTQRRRLRGLHPIAPAAPRADTAPVEAPTAPPRTIVPTTPVMPVMPPHRASSAAREHRITIGRVEVEVHNPAPAAEVPAKPSLAVTPPSFLDVRYLNRFAFRP